MVAPPLRNRSAGHEKYEIDYERLAAFFVEPGQAALIDKGTWHFAVALGAECDLINVIRKDPGEGTSDIDAEMRMDRIPSMRPYVEVLDFARRDKRVLERLWDAYVADAIPYIETLGECWGELCVTRELASIWADNLVDLLRANWTDHKPGSYFQGTPVCLSTLLAAVRYPELLDLLEKAPFVWWQERRWGVRALAAMG